jgi:hypothetical protein
MSSADEARARFAAEREERAARQGLLPDELLLPTARVETRNQKDRREIAEQEKQRAAERAAEAERQQRQVERLLRAATMKRIDERLARLEAEANEISKLTGKNVGWLTDDLKALQSENLELRTLIHKLEMTVDELKAKRSRKPKSGTVIDLPPILPPIRVAQ